ncbi:hypothetical protein NAEGRDRAFT_78595 [Naegleria gruberi]|uniref:Uncharacterized protein n=1 Tax=Naegleria gruberi TaxID=5762 RepID=D2V4T4_NAEGR|nr:uncharacterized protein NAEGRDRAFT_78595 [Naegleria gruberi]EFC48157.1 hypothetical protein NAEGRDRAFT_78595 [Naegleria gruberi]|eukprot:XP_002680901.1 hypothetical protein NAEGRDRAFT_78595 [Naegleria gruberi strain NEG-M]
MSPPSSLANYLLIVGLILSALVLFAEGQACTDQAGLSPTTSTYLCPIGYVNTQVTDFATPPTKTFVCRKVNDMITPINKKQACRTDADCYVSNMDGTTSYFSKLRAQCFSGRCIRYGTRLPGDSCDYGNQCLGGRCDLNTNKCITNVLYTASQGERCGVTFDSLTVTCKKDSNLRCLPERIQTGTTFSSFSYCYAPKTVALGKSCITTDNTTRTYDTCEDNSQMFCNSTLGICVAKLADGSYCDTHAQCKSGDCLNNVCTTLKKSGDTCQAIVECTNTLTCRSSAPKASRVCQTPAALSDYCAADSDCYLNSAFAIGGSIVSTELVICANQRCVRQYGIINGQKCEKDANCHSGYCHPSEGVCKTAPAVSCDGVTSVNTCPNCICNKGTDTAGVCLHNVATNCPGYLMDLQFCVYNNFVSSLTDPLIASLLSLSRADVDSPFLDTESSLYKTCGSYYTNLMRCLYNGNSDKWTAADIDGFSFTGTPTPNVILPKILSGSNTVTYSLVLMILTILSFLLF